MYLKLKVFEKYLKWDIRSPVVVYIEYAFSKINYGLLKIQTIINTGL